jgi:uncharacterized protein (TIGR00369 family)
MSRKRRVARDPGRTLRSIAVTWKDPKALVEAGRAMRGIEFLRAMRDGHLPAPPIAELLGFRLAEVELGRTVFEVEPGEQHHDPDGVVHDGIAMALLDSAMAGAVQTQMPAGAGYATLEAKTNLVRTITAATGKLRAIGRTLHCDRRTATAEGRLEDVEGNLYAHATTTGIVVRRPAVSTAA